MLELLESRRLLAAAPSIVYEPGFSLTVNGGTDGGTMIVREETPTAGSPGPYTYFVELRDVNNNVVPGGEGTTPFVAHAVAILGAGNVDRITFTGYSKGAVISGGNGDDLINVNDAEHPDSTFVRGNGSSIDGGRGDDSIEVQARLSNINGGDDADFIRVSDAVAIIDSGTGNVVGYDMSTGGQSVIDAGNGNDTIVLLAANHTRANGGDGADVIQVNSAAIGGGVDLSSAVAEIFGDKQNDIIDLFDGQNTVDGGQGKDSLFVAAAVDSVTVVPGTIEKTGTA